MLRQLNVLQILRSEYKFIHLSKKLCPFFSNKRNVWLSGYKMEEAVEKLEKNPYYKKYEQKITKFIKEKPSTFLDRAQEVAENIDNEKGGHTFSRLAAKGKPEMPRGAYAFAPKKRLGSIMKVELLNEKTPKEVEYIWTQHFLKKDAISGSLPVSLFDKIQDQAFKYPSFLLPLPRDHGYEFIVTQFAANEIHFTPLINYQTHKENAPECLTMVHFDDLAKTHGIVLMYGEFNKKTTNTHDAQFLANQVQLYYANDDPQKLKLLEIFHTKPSEFKHMDLIEQIEKIDLTALAKGQSKKT